MWKSPTRRIKQSRRGRERNLEDDTRIKSPEKDPFNLKAEDIRSERGLFLTL